MTLCDAGPLFALVDKGQEASARCRRLLPTLSAPLVTTWPCFTEAMYFAGQSGRQPMQDLLWDYVDSGSLRFHDLTRTEQERMRELMRKYNDTPMDLADASLVAAAETLKVSRVFTLDGDFHVYRLRGRTAFEVIS